MIYRRMAPKPFPRPHSVGFGFLEAVVAVNVVACALDVSASF